MKQYYQFILRLTLRGPLLSHKAGALSYGTDMAMQSWQGQPVFNGSLIKGNFVHGIKNTITLYQKHGKTDQANNMKKVLKTWCGSASSDNNWSAERGLLQFDYFWLPEPAVCFLNTQARYRIGIDAASGTVESGNLQVIDSPVASGEVVSFHGSIYAILDDEHNEKAARTCQQYLYKIFNSLDAIGALKGSGFGKIVNADVQMIRLSTPTRTKPHNRQESNVSEATKHDHANSIQISLRLDRPFCIAKPHQADSNRFVSETEIPGGVIKGALANQLKALEDSPVVGDIFEKSNIYEHIRFTHAKPVCLSQQHSTPVQPLSWASDGKRIYDLALKKHAGLLLNDQLPNHKAQALSFSPDWKADDYQLADQLLINKAYPDHHLSVQTKIAAGRNHSDDGDLFSMECIDASQHLWQSEIIIDTEKQDQKNNLTTVKQTISQHLQNYGLSQLGKTHARANVFVKTYQAPQVQLKPQQAIIICLQTPARILPDEPNVQSTADTEGLFRAYSDYWSQASGAGEKLILSHFYAQQQLVGGLYYYHQFLKPRIKDAKNGNDKNSSNKNDKDNNQHQQKDDIKKGGKNPVAYLPAILTNPGSVFVFEPPTDIEIVNDLLNTWLKNGIPVHHEHKHLDWQQNPWLSENGYGEIRVNDPRHWSLCPKDKQWLCLHKMEQGDANVK